MGEKVVTTFPTMGEHPLEGSVVNMSGARSPYTKLAGGNQGKSDAPDSSDSVAGATLIKEANGPQCAPVTTIAYPNAPESNQSMRNVKLMPSKSGVSDFWAQRAEGGRI